MAEPSDNNTRRAPRATGLRQIAEAAGVHVTTVSLALRNSPQLPPHTRERLQKLAQEMGYKPNPMVVALMQQRRQRKESHFQGTLAFITRSPTRDALRDNPYIALIYKTAGRHAEEQGYRLDHFEIYNYGNDPKRLEKALHARNIRGLLFPPPEDPDGTIINLNWEHFAPITLSSSITTPAMDRIDTDHFMGTCLAFQKCIERGYRAPGFVTMQSCDYRTKRRWRAGYLASAHDCEICRHIPVLISPDAAIVENLIAWYEKWRPDVILANALVHEACVSALIKHGIRIPDDVGIVELNIHDMANPNSGIYTGVEISSHRAIDQLIVRLQRNQLGLPVYPQNSITLPIWKDGSTLPPRKV